MADLMTSYIISSSINVVLMGIIIFARKQVKDKVMAKIFKKRVKAVFVTKDHKKYSIWVSKADDKHIQVGETRRLLHPRRVLFDLDNGNAPEYTFVAEDAMPLDYYGKPKEFDAKVLNDLMTSAEAVGATEFFKMLLKHKNTFYIVAGIGVGVAATLVLVFQMTNQLNTIELCRITAGSVLQ